MMDLSKNIQIKLNHIHIFGICETTHVALTSILNNNEYETTFHYSLSTALCEVKVKTPDVIICELVSTDSAGFDFIFQIKKNHLLNNIPILVLTTQTDLNCMSRSIEFGVNAVCFKEYMTYTLPGQLHTLLQLRTKAVTHKNSFNEILEYHSILETMNEGLVIFNSEGNILKYNSAAIRILELNISELAIHKIDKINFKAIHKDGTEFKMEDYPAQIAIRTGQTVTNITMGFILGSNQIKWICANATPLDNLNSQCAIMTFRDITERSQSFHKAKLASLGEMAAGIAHEVNNPLAIIEGSVHLLLRFPGCPKEFKTQLETIEKSVHRISKIITGLRKYSRTSEKQKFKRHSLKTILNDTLTLIDINLKRNFIQTKIICNTDCFILCNEIEIEQVIVNLINNSIDAIKTLNERWIRIEVFETVSTIIFQIQDSGCGLKDDVADKLFQPFFTTKVIGEGTGLGLSIVKGILDDHNAQIQLNTKLTNTCFEISFEKLKEVENAA